MHHNTINGGDNSGVPVNPNRKTRRHPPKATQRAYIGIPEAATYLNVGTKIIRGFIADGTLPAYRIGSKTIRIRIEDLDTILQPVPTAL